MKVAVLVSCAIQPQAPPHVKYKGNALGSEQNAKSKEGLQGLLRQRGQSTTFKRVTVPKT